MRKTIRAKRSTPPDQKYRSILVSQLINAVMRDGKKEKARAIVYRAMDEAAKKLETDPLTVVEVAIKNISPALEVRSKRIGGATYQVPLEVTSERKRALAMRWILTAARARQGKPMENFLAHELLDAYQNTGAAVKKRDDLHKMAEANRAFAHFARM